MQLDFYLLPEQSGSLLHFVQTLLEQLLQQRKRCYVHTEDATMSEALDEHLWQHAAEQFIPHQLEGEGAEKQSPVLIGHCDVAPRSYSYLINLASTAPSFLRFFQAAADVSVAEPSQLEAARKRFQLYKTNKYRIHYHDCREEN